MSDNVTRVLLSEEVSELITYDATQAEAFAVLNAAVDIQKVEGREITLTEALICMSSISRMIEAIG